jgi:hypothetical protein
VERGSSTRNVRITHAIDRLHIALDELAPPNIIYSGPKKIRWGSYDNVLRALREVVQSGGEPSEDERFKDFMQLQVRLLGTPRFEEEGPEGPEDLEHRKFVKTALRLCGVEWKPDGTLSLVRFARKKSGENG